MSTITLKWMPAILLSLGLQAPGAFAQPTPGPALQDRLYASAVDSFRQARFSEAYGRLIRLADSGHVPSAELALWMYANGPALFGKDWDITQDQLTAWAQLAGHPAPTMVVRTYPPAAVKVALNTRHATP